MNKIWLIIALCILCGAGAALYDLYVAQPTLRDSAAHVAEPMTQGVVAPDFEIVDLSGVKRKLSDFRGKWVVLDFWATWCAPCVTTFPSMMQFAAKYREQVIVIALSSDRSPQAVRSFLENQTKETRQQAGYENVVVAIDQGLLVTKELYFTEKYPETILIDPEMRMTKKLVGATNWQSQEMLDWAERTLGARP